MTAASLADAGFADAGRGASRAAAATRALSGWLRLAATPTFAAMALLSGLGGTGMAALCAAGSSNSVNSMALMYAAMSLFHAPAWLNLTPAGMGAARPNR